MNKLYIGFSGKMGSGKSTLAKAILEAFPSFKGEIVSLASPIKNLESMIYSQLGMEHTSKDRPLLIALGMWGRNKDPDFWLKAATKIMSEKDSDIIICDDVRFKNEAEWFEKNGILIRIDGEQRGDNYDPKLSNDPTETGLDSHDFQYRVDNCGHIKFTVATAMLHITDYLKLQQRLSKQIAEGK